MKKKNLYLYLRIYQSIYSLFFFVLEINRNRKKLYIYIYMCVCLSGRFFSCAFFSNGNLDLFSDREKMFFSSLLVRLFFSRFSFDREKNTCLRTRSVENYKGVVFFFINIKITKTNDDYVAVDLRSKERSARQIHNSIKSREYMCAIFSTKFHFSFLRHIEISLQKKKRFEKFSSFWENLGKFILFLFSNN